jgi:hypothetical protein
MIKIAIIICGQPRYIDECSQSIKNYFNLSGVLRADYFIHSWTDTFDWRGEQACDTIVFDENELKQKLITTYNPKKIIIEEQDKCEGLNEGIEKIQRALEKVYSSRGLVVGEDESLNTELGPFGRLLNKWNLINSWAAGQSYSLQEASKLMYAEGVDYNLVVKIRTDIVFEEHLAVDRAAFFNSSPRKCVLTPTKMYSPVATDFKKVADVLFAADKDTFNLLYSDIYDYTVENIIKIIKDMPKIRTYTAGGNVNPLFDGLSYTAARRAQENSIPIKYYGREYPRKNIKFSIYRKRHQNKEII